MTPSLVRLTVSIRGVDHSTVAVPSPTLAAITEALADLYLRLGCEAPGREVRADAADSEGEVLSVMAFHAMDPDASPEEIALDLWKRIERTPPPPHE